MANTISISVLAETKKAREELEKVNTSLGDIKKSATSSVFKGGLLAGLAGKGLDLALEGLSAFGGLVKDSVGEARESQKVNAKTAATILATGGAAKISADGVGALATAISNKTGIDDEAVQTGSNLLLTFKNVRNEAGKGNDVFNQATQAAVDLSAAGFGSIDSASKGLGKALNDPVKGISALSKAGVTFTDQQKEQIKTLTASGDILGAQKIILGEVQAQVGGVAEASASAGDKFKVASGNLKEQFGTILLPYLDKFMNFFTTKIGPAISKGLAVIGPVIEKIVGAVGPAIDTIKGLFSDGGGLSGVASGVKTLFTTVAPIVTSVIGSIVTVIQDNLPAIKETFASIGSTLTSIGSAISTVWGVIGPVVIPIVTTIFTTIITVIKGAFQIISGVFKVISSVLKGDWKGAWEGIKQIVRGAVTIVKAIITNVKTQVAIIFNAIKTKAIAIWTGIKESISARVEQLKTAVHSKILQVRQKMAETFNAIKTKTTEAWNKIKTAVTDKIRDVVAKVKELPGKAKAALSNIKDKLYSSGKDLVKGFISGIGDSLGDVAAKAREIASKAVDAAKAALGIKSPSRVFMKIGQQSTAGLDIGFDPRVTARSGRNAARSLIDGFGNPALAATAFADGGSLSGSSAAPIQVIINFNGLVTDPVATGREVERVLNRNLAQRGKKLVTVNK